MRQILEKINYVQVQDLSSLKGIVQKISGQEDRQEKNCNVSDGRYVLRKVVKRVEFMSGLEVFAIFFIAFV